MSAEDAPFLEVAGLTKRFDGEGVLEAVSFRLQERHVLSVVGRSGCGKTTLLKVIAGLLPADEGSIRRRGSDITSVPAERRDIVYLYQEPLLFPHLSVFENVAFGLRLRHVAAEQIDRDVTRMLESLDLLEHRDKAPHRLSGGQRQRVSFGRALILAPSLLLLDEPFSSLDADTRTQMQDLFKRVAVEYAITAIFVTHDLKEALILGDRLSTLRDGRLHAYETKAEFIADPEAGVAEEVAFWSSLGRGGAGSNGP
jgi:putrescine transport system ATP-binding protein